MPKRGYSFITKVQKMFTKFLAILLLIGCSGSYESSPSADPSNFSSGVDAIGQRYEALMNQEGGKKDQSLKVWLRGYPSGVSTKKNIPVQVTGAPGVTRYAFKIGNSLNTNCSDSSGYRLGSSMNTPIWLQMDRIDKGPVTLCAIGGGPGGVWLPYEMANQVFWENNAPQGNIIVQQPAYVPPAPIPPAQPIEEQPLEPEAPAPDADCTDTPPDWNYSCAQQKEWGKCDKDWMLSGNFCMRSCGRCGY